MDSNPFAAEDPFEDPPYKATNKKYAEDDYFATENPYEAPSTPSATGSNYSGFLDSDPKPSKNNSSSSASSSSRDRAGEDLAKREEALLRREAALLARERAGGGSRENNWPSKCYPIAYHDITAEIPERHRGLVKKFYAIVMLTWLCLLGNWMLVMYAFFGKPAGVVSAASPGTEAVLMSCVYLLLGIPGSWNLWYRAVYNATKTNSSGKWMFFFVNFVIHTLFSMVMTLGPSPAATAGGGLFFVLEMVDEKYNSAIIFSVITMVLWLLNSIISVVVLKNAHTHWKFDGHQATAKRDLAKGIIESGVASEVAGRI